MHAKYQVSISYGSKVIAKVKVDKQKVDNTDKQTDKQTNRQDKNNMPPIIRSGGIKIDLIKVNNSMTVLKYLPLCIEWVKLCRWCGYFCTSKEALS